MVQEWITGIRSTLVLWVLTALLYPLFILIIGQVTIPNQANGSLLRTEQGTIIGSTLIGQSFSTPNYFQSRPSVIDYSVGTEAAPTGVSGASNLAPSNPELIKRIQTQITALNRAGITPTADLVYTSGSGLDPHITPEAALAQVERVARARAIAPQDLQPLITQATEGRFLGIFGEPGVNVLKLNQALDQQDR